MALKRKITKTEYDALPDVVKAEYKAEGDAYVLDLEDSGFDALKAEKAEEKRKREEVEARLEKLTAEKAAADAAAEEARLEAARKAGDVTALEASWQKKHEADVAAARADAEATRRILERTYVHNVARQIAERICIAPDLIEDKISSRLKLEIADGVPVTRVVDAQKRPSALSVNDLEKEFLDNPAYKAIIKGSSAKGGGAGPGGEGNGVPSKKLSEMTATEEAAFANANPDEYKRLLG